MMMTLIVLFACLLTFTTGLIMPSMRSHIARKSLMSKLTIVGGQISDADTTKPTLVYFDARGAAEMIRVILKVSNVDFNDIRFSVQTINGKFETPEFTASKAANELHANMNRIPLFIIETGTRIGQSKAIERYLSKRYDLAGTTPEEEAVIDCIGENVRDIKDKWSKIRAIGGMMKQSEEKDAAIKKWFEEGELAEWLKKLELSLPNTPYGQNRYAVGIKLSYADLCIWNLLSDTFEEKHKVFVQKALQDGCPNLSTIVNRVNDLPRIKAWLSRRPVTMF